MATQLNPEVIFRATPMLVNKGESVTLSWRAKNVSNCRIERDLQRKVDLTGEHKIELIDENKLFEIICSGSKGEIKKLLSIQIKRLADSSKHPLDTLAPGHWFELENSSYISNYPSNMPKSVVANGGPVNIVDAWGGAAFDTSRNRLMISGGGHHDYWGNDIFAFDVNSLTWVWLYSHSDRIPHSDFYNKSYPSRDDNFSKWLPYYKRLQVYSDNSPSASHTYDSLIYLPPPFDELVFLGGTQHKRIHRFNIDKQTWKFPKTSLLSARAGLISAVNTVTGEAYAHSVGDGDRFFQAIDFTKDTVDKLSEQRGWMDYSYTGALSTKNEKFYYLGNGHFFEIDLRTGNRRSVNALGDKSIEKKGQNPGVVYLEDQHKIVAWSGGRDIFVYDPLTNYWTKLKAFGNKSITPGPANKNGTFGRFAYIPSKKAFVLLNQGKGNIFFYRMQHDYPKLQLKSSRRLRPYKPIILEGESIEFVWQSQNTISCSLDGPQHFKDLPTSGRITLSALKTSARHVLKCIGDDGQIIQRMIVVDVITKGPVVDYSFDDISENKIADSSINQNNAFIAGQFEVVRNQNNTSNAIKLTGAKSQLTGTINKGYLNKKNTALTIGTRIFLPQLTKGTHEVFLRFGNKSQNKRQINIATNKFQSIRAGIAYGSEISKSLSHQANSWCDIFLVYDGRLIKLYVDGKLLSGVFHKKGEVQFGPKLTLHNLAKGKTIVDHLSIWQRALTEQEIREWAPNQSQTDKHAL